MVLIPPFHYFEVSETLWFFISSHLWGRLCVLLSQVIVSVWYVCGVGRPHLLWSGAQASWRMSLDVDARTPANVEVSS